MTGFWRKGFTAAAMGVGLLAFAGSALAQSASEPATNNPAATSPAPTAPAPAAPAANEPTTPAPTNPAPAPAAQEPATPAPATPRQLLRNLHRRLLPPIRRLRLNQPPHSSQRQKQRSQLRLQQKRLHLYCHTICRLGACLWRLTGWSSRS